MIKFGKFEFIFGVKPCMSSKCRSNIKLINPKIGGQIFTSTLGCGIRGQFILSNTDTYLIQSWLNSHVEAHEATIFLICILYSSKCTIFLS